MSNAFALRLNELMVAEISTYDSLKVSNGQPLDGREQANLTGTLYGLLMAQKEVLAEQEEFIAMRNAQAAEAAQVALDAFGRACKETAPGREEIKVTEALTREGALARIKADRAKVSKAMQSIAPDLALDDSCGRKDAAQ